MSKSDIDIFQAQDLWSITPIAEAAESLGQGGIDVVIGVVGIAVSIYAIYAGSSKREKPNTKTLETCLLDAVMVGFLAYAMCIALRFYSIGKWLASFLSSLLPLHVALLLSLYILLLSIWRIVKLRLIKKPSWRIIYAASVCLLLVLGIVIGHVALRLLLLLQADANGGWGSLVLGLGAIAAGLLLFRFLEARFFGRARHARSVGAECTVPSRLVAEFAVVLFVAVELVGRISFFYAADADGFIEQPVPHSSASQSECWAAPNFMLMMKSLSVVDPENGKVCTLDYHFKSDGTLLWYEGSYADGEPYIIGSSDINGFGEASLKIAAEGYKIQVQLLNEGQCYAVVKYGVEGDPGPWRTDYYSQIEGETRCMRTVWCDENRKPTREDVYEYDNQTNLVSGSTTVLNDGTVKCSRVYHRNAAGEIVHWEYREGTSTTPTAEYWLMPDDEWREIGRASGESGGSGGS